MKKKFEKVCQFRIDLCDAKPPIWRRVQVPETYSFWDLHVVIQCAMGWTDTHLHEFEVLDRSVGGTMRIGIPDDEFEKKAVPSWKHYLSDVFSEKNPKVRYIYDFGDSWEHAIKLEKTLPREKGADYPRCLAGKRACPPEDCGGVWGYEELLKVIRNPKHMEHKEMLQWLGGEFDPEHFDPGEILFIDPDEHRKESFR